MSDNDLFLALAGAFIGWLVGTLFASVLSASDGLVILSGFAVASVCGALAPMLFGSPYDN